MPLPLLALAAGSLLAGKFGQNQLQRSNQDRNEQKFQSLLDDDLAKFRDREQLLFDQGSGPINPGLLAEFSPSNELLARASALPGRENLLNTVAQGENALRLQKQGQIWDNENMTLAQKTALEATQQQRQWEQSRREFEFNNPSAVQQAQLNAQQQGFGLQQQGIDLQREQFGVQQEANRNKLLQEQFFRQFPGAGLTGKAAIDFQQGINSVTSAVSTLDDAMEFVGRRSVGEGRFGGDLQALNTSIQATVMPAMMDLLNTGVLQDAERKNIQDMMGDPTAFFTTGGRQTKKMAALREVLNRHRKFKFGLAGQQAPEIPRGSSSFVESIQNRSDSARSAPRREDIDFTLPGNQRAVRKQNLLDQ